MTHEQLEKFVRANFETMVVELNKTKAEMLAYRSVAVALAGLLRMQPDNGRQLLENLRTIAFGHFSKPVNDVQRTPYDDHAVTTLKETFELIEQAGLIIDQADRPN